MDCKTVQQKIMPYIQRKLDDNELEEFIEHIHNCKACSEELEVYFTIYYALEKLEQDEQGSYNIQEMLQRDLERSKQQVRKQYVLNFYRRFFLVTVSVLLLIVLFTGVQAVITGSFESTLVFQMLSGEEETASEKAAKTPVKSLPVDTQEMTEPETNRKFQVIITTPETEKMTEIMIDLTGGTPLTVPMVQSDTLQAAGNEGAAYE